MSGPGEKLWTAGELAEAARVNMTTARAWCRRGLVPGAFKVGGRGPWRIPEKRALKFLSAMAEMAEELRLSLPAGGAEARD